MDRCQTAFSIVSQSVKPVYIVLSRSRARQQQIEQRRDRPHSISEYITPYVVVVRKKKKRITGPCALSLSISRTALVPIGRPRKHGQNRHDFGLHRQLLFFFPSTSLQPHLFFCFCSLIHIHTLTPQSHHHSTPRVSVSVFLAVIPSCSACFPVSLLPSVGLEAPFHSTAVRLLGHFCIILHPYAVYFRPIHLFRLYSIVLCSRW